MRSCWHGLYGLLRSRERNTVAVCHIRASFNAGVEEHNRRLFVVLRNGNGVLAVYRVRNDGPLKWIRERFPKQLREEIGPTKKPTAAAKPASRKRIAGD
jgi:hypothetical protein